ncbi:MAG: enoyl-CoA hydratase/isomerase family protein, partial [Dehalococcoidia bacterium]|nr:enoyl-CoA hydratase/isomerase family protein [Dehalococcoidia bacterium]
MSFQCIRLRVDDRVARLTLARPAEMNAVNPEMIEEVIEALADVSAMDDVKALVVSGEGRAFCAGADLTYMEGILKDREALSRYLGRFNEMLFVLEELPIPVIGLVHGYALAGGLEILLACDMVIAAEDARIGDQHINFALIPGGGSTQRLP